MMFYQLDWPGLWGDEQTASRFLRGTKSGRVYSDRLRGGLCAAAGFSKRAFGLEKDTP